MALLENAERLARDFPHLALPALRAVGASAWGPMLIYDWAQGELLRAPAERRADPTTAFQRFRALPVGEIGAAVEAILAAHVGLCECGWVACDFYDGSMTYDFAARRIRLFDLDSYSRGPFVNQMGRLFGSDRFMAPEEYEQGALIDERTTVFNLGRAAAVFLGDGTLERRAFRGTAAQHAAMARACRPDRGERNRRRRRPGRGLAVLTQRYSGWRDQPVAASAVARSSSACSAGFIARSITRWTRSVAPRLATRWGSERRRYQASPGAMSTRRRLSSNATSGLVVIGDVDARRAVLGGKVVVVVLLDHRARRQPHQPHRAGPRRRTPPATSRK